MQIGTAGGGAQELNFLLNAIDALVIPVAPVLLGIARVWGYFFAVLTFVISCVAWSVEWIAGRELEAIVGVVQYVRRLLTTSFLLGFYITPVPGLGVSVSSFFQQLAMEIAGVIDISNVDRLLNVLSTFEANLQKPHALDFFAIVLFYLVFGGIIVLDAALLLVTSLGFFAIGLGLIFGPICISMYMLPSERLREKLWGWVNFMWVYSMYRAVAAAFVYVAATFLMNFFVTALNGNYTLGHLLPLATFMIASILVVVCGAFKVPGWTAELFGTIGHVGSGFESFLQNAAYVLLP